MRSMPWLSAQSSDDLADWQTRALACCSYILKSCGCRVGYRLGLAYFISEPADPLPSLLAHVNDPSLCNSDPINPSRST